MLASLLRYIPPHLSYSPLPPTPFRYQSIIAQRALEAERRADSEGLTVAEREARTRKDMAREEEEMRQYLRNVAQAKIDEKIARASKLKEKREKLMKAEREKREIFEKNRRAFNAERAETLKMCEEDEASRRCDACQLRGALMYERTFLFSFQLMHVLQV